MKWCDQLVIDRFRRCIFRTATTYKPYIARYNVKKSHFGPFSGPKMTPFLTPFLPPKKGVQKNVFFRAPKVPSGKNRVPKKGRNWFFCTLERHFQPLGCLNIGENPSKTPKDGRSYPVAPFSARCWYKSGHFWPIFGVFRAFFGPRGKEKILFVHRRIRSWR